jgi:hypothetical protein
LSCLVVAIRDNIGTTTSGEHLESSINISIYRFDLYLSTKSKLKLPRGGSEPCYENLVHKKIILNVPAGILYDARKLSK